MMSIDIDITDLLPIPTQRHGHVLTQTGFHLCLPEGPVCEHHHAQLLVGAGTSSSLSGTSSQSMDSPGMRPLCAFWMWKIYGCTDITWINILILILKCCIKSSVLAMELPQSYTKPLIDMHFAFANYIFTFCAEIVNSCIHFQTPAKLINSQVTLDTHV